MENSTSRHDQLSCETVSKIEYIKRNWLHREQPSEEIEATEVVIKVNLYEGKGSTKCFMTCNDCRRNIRHWLETRENRVRSGDRLIWYGWYSPRWWWRLACMVRNIRYTYCMHVISYKLAGWCDMTKMILFSFMSAKLNERRIY